MKVLVINGVNLNLTGIREPEIYGSQTLDEINEYIEDFAEKSGVVCEFFQSNIEGELVNAVQRVLLEDFDAGIINAGAYTHYSYALRDAVAATGKPFIEVHMSDINAREEFRKNSVLKDICRAQICGYGKDSYIKALELLKSEGEKR